MPPSDNTTFLALLPTADTVKVQRRRKFLVPVGEGPSIEKLLEVP